jgi:amino acid transporter
MNFDIFVVIFGYFALKRYLEGKKGLSLIILTILTLVKIFPIVLLFGIAIYEYTNKNNSIFNESHFINVWKYFNLSSLLFLGFTIRFNCKPNRY